MKKSMSQVIGKRKSFEAKYFTRSPTMPILSYRTNRHVSVDPRDEEMSNEIKDQRANPKDKRFRSAVGVCLYCSILEFLLMLFGPSFAQNDFDIIFSKSNITSRIN